MIPIDLNTVTMAEAIWDKFYDVHRDHLLKLEVVSVCILSKIIRSVKAEFMKFFRIWYDFRSWFVCSVENEMK